MAIELVCSCGQLLRFNEPPVGGQVRCPQCHALVMIDADQTLPATASVPAITDEHPAATRKPLWAVMGRGQSPPANAGQPSAPAAAPVSNEPEPDSPATEAASLSSGRKGLWSVMQTPAAAFEKPIASHPGAGSDSKRIGPPGAPEPNPKSEIPDSQSETVSPPDSLAAMIGIAADEALLSAQTKAAGFHADNSRRAIVAAVLGGLSIPLSSLALVNAAWSRLPATALGFVAILTGLIASQEIQHSGGRKTGRRLAIAGIVTGIVGSFLGPVVIAPFGRPRKGR